MEVATTVYGNARKGDPPGPRVPRITPQGAGAVIGDPAIAWREIDPTGICPPRIAGDMRVGDGEPTIGGGKIDPARNGAPRIFVG